MKSNYNSLVKTMNANMKTILHPYEINITYHQMHYLVVVGLLHLFDPCLHERIPFEYHLNFHEYLYFGCYLLFLINPFEYQKCDKYTQMVLYPTLVMHLAPLKTKPRFLNHL